MLLTDPIWLVLLGLSLNTAGSLLLAMDSLGGSDYVAAVDNTAQPYRSRMAQIGLRAFLNQLLLFVGTATIGFAVLVLVGQSITTALIIGPTFYFVWRAVSHVTMRLYHLSERTLGSATKMVGGGCRGAMVALALLPMHLVAFSLMAVVEYGISIPLSWFSERFIEPTVVTGLRRTSRMAKEEARWSVRRRAIIGVVLLFFGFAYQLIGVAFTFYKAISAGAA